MILWIAWSVCHRPISHGQTELFKFSTPWTWKFHLCSSLHRKNLINLHKFLYSLLCQLLSVARVSHKETWDSIPGNWRGHWPDPGWGPDVKWTVSARPLPPRSRSANIPSNQRRASVWLFRLCLQFLMMHAAWLRQFFARRTQRKRSWEMIPLSALMGELNDVFLAWFFVNL